MLYIVSRVTHGDLIDLKLIFRFIYYVQQNQTAASNILLLYTICIQICIFSRYRYVGKIYFYKRLDLYCVQRIENIRPSFTLCVQHYFSQLLN